MKNSLVLPLSAILALLVASPAHATAPAPSSTYVDWSGFYVGLHVGGTWGNFNTGPNGTGGDASGGIHGGYNWQRGPWVFGPEAEFSGIDVPAKSPTTEFDEDWMMTLRGRVGYTIDRYLPFATAGIAITDTSWSVTGVGSSSSMRTGVAVGGGVDAQISGPWSARAEYLYTDVPNETVNVGATTLRGGSNNHTLRLGVNYQFN